MSPFLLEKPYPGATTCVVIGSLAGISADYFHDCRHIQWWRDAEDALPAPLGPVEQVPLEEIVNDADLSTKLERLLRRDARHLPSVYITQGVVTRPTSAYERVIAAVHASLESTHRARLTRQKDGFTWQKHVVQNAPAYIRNRLPNTWAGALRGLPTIVCGAGPSLDKSILALTTVAERAVIISADSALRALARNGVAADFAVSTDAAKVPEKCLPTTHLPQRVVLSSVSPPAWQTAVPASPKFFLSGAQLTDDWLATQGVARTAFSAAESCGSTGIELAHYLGCDPIFLFGIDLAVDPANQARRHQNDADPALYTQSNYDPTATLPRVPGNYAETVPSFALGDWRELDARLAARTTCHVFNVTDRGAQLRGTTVVHPNQFALAARAGAKTEPLARLADHRGNSPVAGHAALARFRALGVRGQQALPALRHALANSGPAGLAAAFRPLVLDPEAGRILGGFALKLMPHLVPPIEGDSAFWQTLLDEFAELSGLLQATRSASVDPA